PANPRLGDKEHTLAPGPPPERMVSEPLDLLGQAVSREPLESLHNLCVQSPPLLLQQTPIGHLVGQGVLEGIHTLRKEAGLVEELGGLEVRQAMVQSVLGQLGNSL